MTIRHRIAPYKNDHGFWVFDAPKLGLREEPLVKGTDTLLTKLYAGVFADPRTDVCVLAFSDERVYPTSLSAHFLCEENDGAWYRVIEAPFADHEAWLCKMLYKYYDKPPKKLFFDLTKITPKPLIARDAKVLRAMIALGGNNLKQTEVGLAAGYERARASIAASNAITALLGAGLVKPTFPGKYTVNYLEGCS